jgi:hypothetical protein
MVIGAYVVSVFLLSGMMSLNVPSRVNTRHPRTATVFLQAVPQKNSDAATRPGQRGGRKMGDWLQAHKNLPVDQQLKLLEKEPGFSKLSPDRQSALRDRLRKFNSLPPAKQDQALQRMAFLANLSQQQREQLRNASLQLRGLPPDRQLAVHTAVRHLRQMPPAERQQVIQSERFRSTFSSQEQSLIGQLTALPGESGSAQNPQAK